MSRPVVIKILAGFLLVVAFTLGIHRFAFKNELNKCEMTYMFEYPQYIQIKLPKNASTLSYGYKLFVYGEGKLAERYHKGKFDGIPVLFLPGNAGSYKQVRSLGSLAYRKSLDSKKHFHFDFFTIDFNEELSALYGGVLQQQAAFTNECIQQILSLYKKATAHPEKTLLLIGHSMGGVIAKAVFSTENFDSGSVNTIITLATPHKSPVVGLDKDFFSFYSKTREFWEHPSDSTAHITLASISGADRDIQVHPGLSVADPPSINIMTSEIPTVWLGTDHLCIVWCKQVVLVVVRSLFDLVDQSTKNWIQSADRRYAALSYHYIERARGKNFEDNKIKKEFTFDPDGRWRESVAAQFTASVEKDDKTNNYFMIPLVDNAFRDRLVAISSALPLKYWVFGCVALAWKNSVRFCENGVDLSGQSLLLPNAGDGVKRKLIYLDLVELKSKGFTHIVFNIPKNHQQGSIIFDVHRSIDRKLEINFPLMRYVPLLPTRQVNIPNGALSLNITLPDLQKPWQSIALKVLGKDCPTEKKVLIRKIVPWAHESQFFLSNETSNIYLYFPKRNLDIEKDSAYIQIINPHPECRYEIAISFDWIGLWAQIVRNYSPLLLPLMIAVLLHCFSMQLRAKDCSSPVPSTLSCLIKMPVVKLTLVPETISLVLGYLNSSRLLLSFPFFSPSDLSFFSDGLYFPFLYILLGGVAWSLVLILSALFFLGISAGGHLLHTLFIRYLRSSFGFSIIVAEIVAMGLSRTPLVIAVALVGIASSTCGSLGIMLGFCIFIWKLFSCYEDELESMLTEEENQEIGDDFNLNMTIALLWLCTGFLSLPTLIVWIKSPSLVLPSDHTLYPSFAWIILGMMALKNSDPIPSTNGVYRGLAYITSVQVVLIFVYGLIWVYRTQYFVLMAVGSYSVSKYFM